MKWNLLLEEPFVLTTGTDFKALKTKIVAVSAIADQDILLLEEGHSVVQAASTVSNTRTGTGVARLIPIR